MIAQAITEVRVVRVAFPESRGVNPGSLGPFRSIKAWGGSCVGWSTYVEASSMRDHESCECCSARRGATCNGSANDTWQN
jgi:hypothetical protein